MIFIYAELLLKIRCDRREMPVSSKWGRAMCLHLAGRSNFSQFLSVRVSTFLFQAFHLSSDFQRVFLWLEKKMRVVVVIWMQVARGMEYLASMKVTPQLPQA